MKNLRLIKVVAILIVIVVPFFVVLSQKYQINVSSNQTGWVVTIKIKQAKVKSKTKTPKEVTSTTNIKATVGVNGLNVREQPSLSSSVVGKLNLGTKITVNDEQSGWAKIEWLPHKFRPWLSRRDRTIVEEALELTNSMDYADKPIGKVFPVHGGLDPLPMQWFPGHLDLNLK